MIQPLFKLIVTIFFRLIRRFVELPLAIIFGLMLMLLLVSLLTVIQPSTTALMALEFILEHVILAPLGLPYVDGTVNLDTDQMLKLFTIWYVIYTVLAELIGAILKQFTTARIWPRRRITFVILLVGYAAVAILMGFGMGRPSGFAWWPTQVSGVLMGVAGISLSFSWLVGRVEKALTTHAAPAGPVGNPGRF